MNSLPTILTQIKQKVQSDKILISLTKDSFSFFILGLIGLLLTYLSNILIVRYYGLTAMGTLRLCLTVATFLTPFAIFGMKIPIVRAITHFDNAKRRGDIKYMLLKIFTFSLCLALIGGILLYLSAGYLAEYVFNNTTLTTYLEYISIGIIPITALSLFASSFQGFKKIPKQLMAQSLLLAIIFLFLLIANYYLHWSYDIVTLYVGATLCSALVMGVTLYRYIARLYNRSTERIFYSLKTTLALARPMLSTNILSTIRAGSGVLFLGNFHTEKEVALYAITLMVSQLPSFFHTSISAVSLPKISACYEQKNIIQLRKNIHKSTQLIILFSLPISIVFLTFPKFFLSFFGDEAQVAYIALILLCIGQMVHILSGNATMILNVTNHQKQLRNIMLIDTLCLLFLYFILAPYGIEGVALASAIALIALKIMTVITIKKRLGFWIVSFPNIFK